MSVFPVSKIAVVTKKTMDKKCINDRSWIASKLDRSSPDFMPVCSQLDFFSVSESDCRKSEALANQFFMEDNVFDRLCNCTTYFKKIQTVAFDLVKKYKYVFLFLGHLEVGQFPSKY